MIDPELDLWASVQSLADFGEATAQWLERRIHYHPAYGSDLCPGPNDETAELVPVLGPINRAGFVTVMSQPGRALDDEGSAQRASLSGFASFDLSERLELATCMTDLIILRLSPMEFVPHTIPITISPKRKAEVFGDAAGISPVCTREGGVGGPANIEIFVEFEDSMLELLANSMHVVMIDPVWGRNDLLWETVLRAVGPT
jgi:hypothetical protein